MPDLGGLKPMELLKLFIDHPITNIVIAIVLIVSSLLEGWESFSEDISEFDLGVHHGVLLFGVVMLLRGVVEALEAIVRAHEKANHEQAP
jgi:uncharacterized membrane protein HdeD (DUF308 family)